MTDQLEFTEKQKETLNDLRRRIVELYTYGKQLMLRAEECDLNVKSFMQPALEYRNAFDHSIRVDAATLGILGDGNYEYVLENSKKALGHVYRAFFDIADWLAIDIREQLFHLLGDSYSVSTIKAVLPKYYQEICPGIDQASKTIARLRGEKDVATEGILAGVVEYKRLVEQLLDWLTSIAQAIPALDEHQRRENVGQRWSRLWQVGVGLCCAAAGAILTWLLTR